MLFESGYHFFLGYLDVVVSFRHRENNTGTLNSCLNLILLGVVKMDNISQISSEEGLKFLLKLFSSEAI